MSMFDANAPGKRRELYRTFLALPKGSYKKKAGFNQTGARGKRYPVEAMALLEVAVNDKATRAEAPDTTLGERYCIARDYQGMSDAKVAREMGVSRELARRWGSDINRPSDLARLSGILKVPEAWLREGGEANLPADCHVGVRVGAGADNARERLYGMTLAILADMPDDASEDEQRVSIERSVFEKHWLARAARQAGGRWQVTEGMLMFAPWQPIQAHGLARKNWSDEVEVMIEEELATKHSTYAAWYSLKARCEALGILKYPKLISLHKRVKTERRKIEQHGCDLNGLVADSIRKLSGS